MHLEDSLTTFILLLLSFTFLAVLLAAIEHGLKAQKVRNDEGELDLQNKGF